MNLAPQLVTMTESFMDAWEPLAMLGLRIKSVLLDVAFVGVLLFTSNSVFPSSFLSRRLAASCFVLTAIAILVSRSFQKKFGSNGDGKQVSSLIRNGVGPFCGLSLVLLFAVTASTTSILLFGVVFAKAMLDESQGDKKTTHSFAIASGAFAWVCLRMLPELIPDAGHWTEALAAWSSQFLENSPTPQGQYSYSAQGFDGLGLLVCLVVASIATQWRSLAVWISIVICGVVICAATQLEWLDGSSPVAHFTRVNLLWLLLACQFTLVSGFGLRHATQGNGLALPSAPGFNWFV